MATLPSDTQNRTRLEAADRSRAVATVLACYLGWALDAFDYFIVVLTIDNIAHDFHVAVSSTVWAITLTLFCRPAGAFLFGRLADRYGRKRLLIACIGAYSLVELASAAAPSLAAFLVLRALFGVALGGEWGVGASLTMESIPAHWRGPVSGLLQTGYPTGYLLAGLLFLAEPWIGWRGMFVVGALPALLTLFVWRRVEESPEWLARRAADRAGAAAVGFWSVVRRNAGRAAFVIVLMTAFNLFSHGSQDLYPKVLLGRTLHFSPGTIALIVVLYNVGAMVGGLLFGTLSERIGRRRAISIAALLALPLLPLFAWSTTPLRIGIGAVLMQVCVQGAWGVVPAYLNELSPPEVRATFPGFFYQLGNLIASPNGNLQLWLARVTGGGIPEALTIVLGTVAIVIAVLTTFGPDTSNVRLGRDATGDAERRVPPD